MDLNMTAVLLSGVAWTLTYLALVYRGFRDRSYGMPLAALALNFTWEITFSQIYPPHTIKLMGTIINTVWMLCDVGIVATFFLYGYKYFERHYGLGRAEFYVLSFLAFAASFGVMLLGAPFFKDFLPYFRGDPFESGKFIAFIQNAAMSVLFVAMFYQRRSIEGQSFTIAWTKWLGTSMTVGLTYLGIEHRDNWHFVGVFVAVCFVFDVWYMVLIYRQLRQQGINPWTRL